MEHAADDNLATYHKKFIEYIDQTGINVIQENGQRKFGGPPLGWEGPPPPRGTEVHVSNLPHNCFEYEIIPLFSKAGTIYETRLMMEFDGHSRGYCFIRFSTVKEAKTAVQMFNDYEIRPGRKIIVAVSVDNCRLFLGGIPNDKTKEDVLELFANNLSGLKDVIIYKNVDNRQRNRGFCFLEFENHRLAAMARRHLIPEKAGFWGRHLIVDWAEPEPDYLEEEDLDKITDLYMRNLSDVTDEECLRKIITSIVPSHYITRIKKVKDFAFVHFSNRKVAERVLKALDGKTINGEVLSVLWKRPSKESREVWLNRIKYNSRPRRYLIHQRLPDKYQLMELYNEQNKALTSPQSNNQKDDKNGSSEPHEFFSPNEYNEWKRSLNFQTENKSQNCPNCCAAGNCSNVDRFNAGVVSTPESSLYCSTRGPNSNGNYVNYDRPRQNVNSDSRILNQLTNNATNFAYWNNMFVDCCSSPPAVTSPRFLNSHDYSHFQFPNSASGMFSPSNSSNAFSNVILPASPSLNIHDCFTFPESPKQHQIMSLPQTRSMPYHHK